MCRLFGLLASPREAARPWLVDSDRSLLVQSHVSEERAQKDGWGIAWYEGSRSPRIEKGLGGPYEPEERPRFEKAASAAHGPLVIAHLRHASNPMGLPHSRLIALENSQPFTYEGTLFAHNGEVKLPRETRARLGKFESHVKGVNDSEILFWLMTRHLGELGDPLAAYRKTRDEIVDVWKSNGSPTKEPYGGLNVIFSRGPNEIWAFCHWRGEHGGGLLATQQPYFQMGYRTDTRSLLVGSEPFATNLHDWTPIKDGEYLCAQVDTGLVGARTGTIG
jgi:predicted glutamine amidotransferase